MFTDPGARKVYVHWEEEASGMLGRFRAAAGRRPDDPDFTDLIEDGCIRPARKYAPGGHAMTWPRSAAGRSTCTTRPWATVAFQPHRAAGRRHPEQTLVYFTTDEVPAAKLSALAAEIG